MEIMICSDTSINAQEQHMCVKNSEDMCNNCDETEYTPSNVPLEAKPYEGKEFRSEDEAYDFYNAYGRLSGFSIRKFIRKESKKEGGALLYRQFCCSKQGEHERKRTDISASKTLRVLTRTGCKAMIEIKTVDGRLVTSRFYEKHNHILMTPLKSHLLRSQRNITDVQKKLIYSYHGHGMGATSIMNVIRGEAGGHGNISFDEDDVRRLIREKRKQTFGHEAMILLNYFSMKRRENPSFFYEIQIDEEGTLCNVIWIDSRARMDYQYFGDVVTFDTTYNTNQYKMPFAPFIGVNHHQQSILFGCALLIDETQSSFEWLFQTWLNAMEGRYQRAILTDQDPAMIGAISNIFPHTVHRLCLWHILSKVPDKLSHMYRMYDKFGRDWNKCIYDVDTIEEFEVAWKNLEDSYNISSIEWVARMYGLRQMWIPVFLKDTFFAGMSTTQCSESMNSFFNGYITKNTSLNEFVVQFDKALEARRAKEKKQDFKTLYNQPGIRGSILEKEMSEIFTAKVFKILQEENTEGLYNYAAECVGKFDQLVHFQVWNEMVDVKHRKIYIVEYDQKDEKAVCSCRLWPFKGIVCRHIFSVFRMIGIRNFPSHYVLKRWTKDAKNCSIYDDISLMQGDLKKSLTMRHSELCILANKCTSIGAKHEETFWGMRHDLIQLEEKYSAMCLSIEGAVKESSYETSIVDVGNHDKGNSSGVHQMLDGRKEITIKDPSIAHPKGSGKRIKSSKEMQPRKSRQCQVCLQFCHNKRTCPMVPSAASKDK